MGEHTPQDAPSPAQRAAADPSEQVERLPLPAPEEVILDVLLENTPSLVTIFDEESTIVRTSVSTGAFMGLPAEQLLGHRICDYVSGEHRGGLEQALAGRAARTEGPFHEEPLERERLVRITWAPVSAGSGPATGGLILAEDATSEQLAKGLAERFAFFDPVTETPNRTLLTSMLERALDGEKAKRRQLALVWLNLDRFKDVNDARGQAVGDQLLRAVATRLRESIRTNDMIGRIGADDFLLVLPRIHSEAHVKGLLRRVKRVFTEPFVIDGHPIHISASCGVAVHPNGGADARELQEHAHTAMRVAKSAGGSTCHLFDSGIDSGVTDKVRLAEDFRHALDNEHFLLHFQPQVDLAEMRVTGVEALVRWQHAERGLVSPDEFIPFAEESGLIEELGGFVLREGCSRAAAWHAALDSRPRLAVNVSAREIHRTDVCGQVRKVARKAGLPLEHIEVEITETAVLADPEHAAEVAACLREAGASVALDDFGTGYSSLTHLRELPIDRVKIDQSFVASCLDDRSASAILVAVTHLAHDLGMEVVAEGVETQAQLDFLRAVGCDAAQGYHLARPLPHDECTDYLLRAQQGPVL